MTYAFYDKFLNVYIFSVRFGLTNFFFVVIIVIVVVAVVVVVIVVVVVFVLCGCC